MTLPKKYFIKYLQETLIETVFEEKKPKPFSLVLQRVNIRGVKPLEWHQARIWPRVATRRQKESEFSLSTGAYSWPQPVKADDLMIHSGKQGRMTSGLSFPHHFYQLPLERQHVGGQDDCMPQNQAVMSSQPLEQEHKEGPSMTHGNSAAKQRLYRAPGEQIKHPLFIQRLSAETTTTL